MVIIIIYSLKFGIDKSDNSRLSYADSILRISVVHVSSLLSSVIKHANHISDADKGCLLPVTYLFTWKHP